MFEPDVIRVDTQHRMLAFDGFFCPCTIGKGGARPAADKHEGDGATPLGEWPIRAALLRPRAFSSQVSSPDDPENAENKGKSRIEAPTALALPWRWIRANDGWCDDPADPAYNRPIHLPRPTSHERLARDDQAYDVIIVLGHNDAPPVPGMGSAIFFHQWVIGEDGAPKATEGCVAIAPESMRAILPLLRPGMLVRIG